jgi:hypothetical protein
LFTTTCSILQLVENLKIKELPMILGVISQMITEEEELQMVIEELHRFISPSAHYKS